jgi:iron(III) transport system permease protein
VWSVAVAAIAILGAPLAFLLLSSFRGPPEFLPIEPGARWTLENFAYFYLDGQLYTEILPNTLVFAAGSLTLSCAVALCLAWHFERPKTRATVWARMLIFAPMALPTPALAMAWIQLLGPNAGWINQAWRSLTGSGMESGPFNIFSMMGLIWCQGVAGIPAAYLLLSPAVRAARYDMEEAGYVAGARPGTNFRQISMPTILPSLAGPLLIMFLISLEQVDFPYFLGPTAGINVLGTRILWEATAPSGLPNIGATSAAAVLILTLAFVGLAVHDRYTRTFRSDFGVSARREGHTRWRPTWEVTAMWVLLGAYLLVAFVLPLGALLVQAMVNPNTAGSLEQCCSNGFAFLAADGRFWKAVINTLLVAIAAAVIGTSIGVSIGLCSAGDNSKVGSALNRLSMSSVAIPSLLVAFGVAVMFMSIPVGIYGTVGLLVIAYSYRISLSTRMSRGALAQVSRSLYEASSVSGARWIRTQITIVLPLILPSILASAAFLFVAGVKEFIIPLMLYSPDNVVLSVMLPQLQQAGNSAGAAAIGLVMTAVTLAGVAGLVLADDRLTQLGRVR